MLTAITAMLLCVSVAGDPAPADVVREYDAAVATQIKFLEKEARTTKFPDYKGRLLQRIAAAKSRKVPFIPNMAAVRVGAVGKLPNTAFQVKQVIDKSTMVVEDLNSHEWLWVSGVDTSLAAADKPTSVGGSFRVVGTKAYQPPGGGSKTVFEITLIDLEPYLYEHHPKFKGKKPVLSDKQKAERAARAKLERARQLINNNNDDAEGIRLLKEVAKEFPGTELAEDANFTLQLLNK